MSTSPPADTRLRRVGRLLELAVGTVVAVRAVAGLPAVGPAAPSPPPPLPLAVDLEADPPARLELLPGIGPVRAAAIASERALGGPFRTADGLRRVRGIGPVTIRRIRAAREVRPRFGGDPAGGEGVSPSGR